MQTIDFCKILFMIKKIFYLRGKKYMKILKIMLVVGFLGNFSMINGMQKIKQLFSGLLKTNHNIAPCTFGNALKKVVDGYNKPEDAQLILSKMAAENFKYMSNKERLNEIEKNISQFKNLKHDVMENCVSGLIPAEDIEKELFKYNYLIKFLMANNK